MENKLRQKYRGTRPLIGVAVVEGDGENNPLEKVEYVLSMEMANGILRPVTIGKVVPLTQMEQSWFSLTNE